MKMGKTPGLNLVKVGMFKEMWYGNVRIVSETVESNFCLGSSKVLLDLYEGKGDKNACSNSRY